MPFPSARPCPIRFKLNRRSPRFHELWAQHDVVAFDSELVALLHPLVGDGQSLFVGHPADPDSAAELSHLASMGAGRT